MDEEPVETTLYSLSDYAPEPDCRREDQRHMTLFRVGSITLGNRRELCLIKNISAGGMMIRAYGPIEVEERLTIELKCGQPVSGRAHWVRGNQVGIVFDEKVDVIDLLSVSMSGPRPRMPRIEVDAPATLRQGADIARVRLVDISQGGAKVKCETRFAPMSESVLSLGSLPPIHGVVRWSGDGFVGLTFNRLVALPTLVEFLQGHQQTLRAAG
ncbi:PilZ domain-containing protein [Sphingomonas rhizophila]|uniref:PilZ domain-containing protein n=1 Tax=Sphingomonas rhizophila TaxID=2071607 RepID=A0A7G9SE07_9SPHN|nr:PilZ domain-containing protein [Sphingomonas rhizophila]QNN66082.1 PilZ domain-containing protein [Sphingomonas rhizophila]